MIKAVIDLSGQFSPARDQGERPTCIAFALSDAHAFYRAKSYENLSPEYIFFFAVQQQIAMGLGYELGIVPGHAFTALQVHGHPLEKYYPYLNIDADAVLPSPPDPFPHPLHKNLVNFIEPSKEKIIDVLNEGIAPVLGIGLTREFLEHAPVIKDDSKSPVIGFHAIIAVGYGNHLDGSEYIKIRNSWGEGWGEAGYAWISSGYLSNQLKWATSIGKSS